MNLKSLLYLGLLSSLIQQVEAASLLDTCELEIAATGMFTPKRFDRDLLGISFFKDEIISDYLDGKFVSVNQKSYDKAIRNLRIAELGFRKFTNRIGIPPHISQTHSWHDLMVQALAVMWPIHDNRTQRALAFAIMALHLLDDLADSQMGSLRLGMFWREPGGLYPALSRMNGSNSIGELTFDLVKLLEKELSHFSPRHHAITLFGIKRMLEGSPIFQADYDSSGLLLIRHQIELMNELDPLSEIAQMILRGELHPFTIALSIKPIYEVIDAIQSDSPNFADSIAKSIFLGGLVYVHNDGRERQVGESRRATRITRNQLLHDLNLIASLIIEMPTPRRQKVLRDLPSIIEAFSIVLQRNGLLDFYMNFLLQPEIKNYLHPDVNLTALIFKMRTIRRQFQATQRDF